MGHGLGEEGGVWGRDRHFGGELSIAFKFN